MVQSSDKRVLTAATQIVRKGLAQITLLGDPESVSQDADRLGLDLTGINVVDHMVSLLMHLAQIEQYMHIHMYPGLPFQEGTCCRHRWQGCIGAHCRVLSSTMQNQTTCQMQPCNFT